MTQNIGRGEQSLPYNNSHSPISLGNSEIRDRLSSYWSLFSLLLLQLQFRERRGSEDRVVEGSVETWEDSIWRTFTGRGNELVAWPETPFPEKEANKHLFRYERWRKEEEETDRPYILGRRRNPSSYIQFVKEKSYWTNNQPIYLTEWKRKNNLFTTLVKPKCLKVQVRSGERRKSVSV